MEHQNPSIIQTIENFKEKYKDIKSNGVRTDIQNAYKILRSGHVIMDCKVEDGKLFVSVCNHSAQQRPLTVWRNIISNHECKICREESFRTRHRKIIKEFIDSDINIINPESTSGPIIWKCKSKQHRNIVNKSNPSKECLKCRKGLPVLENIINEVVLNDTIKTFDEAIEYVIEKCESAEKLCYLSEIKKKLIETRKYIEPVTNLEEVKKELELKYVKRKKRA